MNFSAPNRVDEPVYLPQTWILSNRPEPVTILIGLYLLLIYKIIPTYMQYRKPYKLTKFMISYNLFQIVSCIYLVSTIWKNLGFTAFTFWECGLYPINSEAERSFDVVIWFTLCLKLTEFTDTIVFVLRKKKNQVSFLHVFHHCSTVILVYLQIHNMRGGASLFPLLLNSSIHIIMYSYYTIAATASRQFVQKLNVVKKCITTLQMIQFVFVLLQVAVTISIRDCHYDPRLAVVYIGTIAVDFYLFYDFYKKAYQHKDGKAKKRDDADENNNIYKRNLKQSSSSSSEHSN